MALLVVENRLSIKTLRIEKGWAVDWLLSYQREMCGNGVLCMICKKNWDYGIVERLPGSGRRRSVRTQSNIKLVSDLILSQEGQPGTSKSPREIARDTGISHSSVVRIAKNDL